MAYQLDTTKKRSSSSNNNNETTRTISQDRWRLVLLVVSMATVTILQVGFFHIRYQPDERTIPDAPFEKIRAGYNTRNQNNATKSSSSLMSSEPKSQSIHTIVSRTTAAEKRADDSSLASQEERTKPLAQTLATPNNATTPSSSSSSLRFDVLARRHGPKPQFPPDFDRTGKVIDILQDTSFDMSTLRPLQLELQTNMLGILVDGGRHYFTIEWLKRLIDVLAVLQYNLIHFRLTDDQAFAIQLESQPALACPTHIHGNTKVYSRDDMREFIAYARAKGISVVPEINVPGHAGAWMGIPGLVVPCRNHACNKGYALPLNISHPDLRTILTDVIREVLDIFENPPYLHLGGDEMELAKPCFDEVKAELFDYNDFEGMLQEILHDVGYPEEQVIRWRETSFAAHTLQNTARLKAKKRAGTINHWWHDTPGKTENVTIGTPIIGSARLYMDVNADEAAWEVFLHSRKWWHLDDVFAQNAPVNLKGIIVGGFELDAGFFHDRNVVGRLLAVTIGVSSVTIENGNQLNELYGRLCQEARFPDALCRKYGLPTLSWGSFRSIKWTSAWKEWKKDICDRFPKAATQTTTKKIPLKLSSVESRKRKK